MASESFFDTWSVSDATPDHAAWVCTTTEKQSEFGGAPVSFLSFFDTWSVSDVASTYRQSDFLQEKRQSTVPDVETDFPDGGLRAWLVIAGIMCATFSTFGYAMSWGVFQAYYEQNILSSYPPSDIAWIGSIQFSLILLPGLVTGRMFDIGYFKLPLFIASVVLVASTFLVAECKEYWQFLLCQGLATGLSSGMIFGPTIGIVGHWFDKRRGLALGFCASGSSLGGMLLPIAARNLINVVGFHWTMRILGFILLVGLGCTNLLLDRRLPPVNVSGGLFNFRAFKSLPYSIYCLSALFTFIGMYTLVVYIDISSVLIGIDADLAFYLVAIVNGSSMVARVFTGMLSDRIGAVNIMVPMSTLGAILTVAWPFVRSGAGLVTIAAIYGITIGTYITAFALPLYGLGGNGDVGRRTGMALTIIAIGALAGPPMSGAINKATGGFIFVGINAGVIIVAGAVLMLITRHIVLGRLWGRF